MDKELDSTFASVIAYSLKLGRLGWLSASGYNEQGYYLYFYKDEKKSPILKTVDDLNDFVQSVPGFFD